jgi:flagellar protein FliS
VAAQITSVDRSQLLLLLLDGGVRFLRQARVALVAGELERFQEQLGRGQAVIGELLRTVDREAGGPIGRDLARLYTFMLFHLTEAHARKSVRHLDEVVAALAPIVDAFGEVLRRPAPEA